MSSPSIGFIGGGRIVRILLAGWSRAGRLPQEAHVSDPNEDALERLQRQFPTIAVSPNANAAAASHRLVLLACHPPVLAETLQEIRGLLRDDATLISVAPKFTIAKISELLGGFRRIARSIPNAASLVNQGYNPISFAAELGESEREEILALFAPLGACPVVDEGKLEAHAILTAMGPTYFWPQFITLTDLAEEFGLSGPEAAAGLCAMVAGSLAMLRESGLNSQELMDLIPVKPLSEEQPQLQDAYRKRLTDIYQKIKP